MKEVGNYECQLRLHKEVQVSIPFEVLSENYQELEIKKEEIVEEAPAVEAAPEVTEAPEATTEA